jgi:hypothetical protein
MARWYLYAVCFFILALPAVPRAEVFTCPWKQADAVFEGGPETSTMIEGKLRVIRFGIQEDIGGDYDDNAPQYEWNSINSDQYNTPATIRCVSKNVPKETVYLDVPLSMKRCIEKKGHFLCKSGTVSCVGYQGAARIEVLDADGTEHPILPSSSHGAKKKQKVLWANLDASRNGLKMVARCVGEDSSGEIETLEIPPEMKACSFMNRRFRCTDTPDQYDLFWPKD